MMNPQTQPRIFRAETMQAALEQIQHELGADALVISVRQVNSGPDWQIWRRPGVEVLAAPGATPPAAQLPKSAVQMPPAVQAAPVGQAVVEPVSRQVQPAVFPSVDRRGKPKPTAKAQPANPTPAPEPPQTADQIAALLRAVATGAGKQAAKPKKAAANFEELETLMDSLVNRLEQAAVPAAPAAVEKPMPAAPVVLPPLVEPAPTPVALPKGLMEARQRLLAQELDPEWVTRLIDLGAQTLRPQAQASLHQSQAHLARQIEAGLRSLTPEIALRDRLICLVGSSGSGKTSTLARLAVLAKSMGKRVAWLSTDTLRAGAIAEARAYATSLAIPLWIAYNPAEALDLINQAGEFDLILLDTPRVNPRKETELAELGELLSSLPPHTTYLLAPATAKACDLRRAVQAFGLFGLRGLILTKLDESETIGSLLNLVQISRLPVAFITDGAAINGTLHAAQAAPLAQAAFGERSWK